MCDTIFQSLSEYLMDYSSLTVDIFLTRTQGYSLQWPIRGGFARKEYLIWASGIYKSGDLLAEVYERVGKCIISVCKKDPT